MTPGVLTVTSGAAPAVTTGTLVANPGALAPDLVQDDRVSSALSTGPALFERERDRIHHRNWVWVAHESELPKAGDYRMGSESKADNGDRVSHSTDETGMREVRAMGKR